MREFLDGKPIQFCEVLIIGDLARKHFRSNVPLIVICVLWARNSYEFICR